jgi:hypothetical protein
MREESWIEAARKDEPLELTASQVVEKAAENLTLAEVLEREWPAEQKS